MNYLEIILHKILSTLGCVIVVLRKNVVSTNNRHYSFTANRRIIKIRTNKTCEHDAYIILFYFYEIKEFFFFLRPHRYLIMTFLRRPNVIEPSSSNILRILHEIGSTPNNSGRTALDMQML